MCESSGCRFAAKFHSASFGVWARGTSFVRIEKEVKRTCATWPASDIYLRRISSHLVDYKILSVFRSSCAATTCTLRNIKWKEDECNQHAAEAHCRHWEAEPRSQHRYPFFSFSFFELWGFPELVTAMHNEGDDWATVKKVTYVVSLILLVLLLTCLLDMYSFHYLLLIWQSSVHSHTFCLTSAHIQYRNTLWYSKFSNLPFLKHDLCPW